MKISEDVEMDAETFNLVIRWLARINYAGYGGALPTDVTLTDVWREANSHFSREELHTIFSALDKVEFSETDAKE